MLPTTHLLAFTVASFVLIVVPGPSVLFTVGRALALGRVAGVVNVAGNTAGVYVQVLAVAFGIGALVQRSVMVFTIIKLAGAGYLIYLGVQAIRHRRRLAGALEARIRKKSLGRLVADGFVVGPGQPEGRRLLRGRAAAVRRPPGRSPARTAPAARGGVRPGWPCCRTARGPWRRARRGRGWAARPGGWSSSAGPAA